MKPEPDLDISAKNVAALHGNDVQPLSKLAAQNDKERAELEDFADAVGKGIKFVVSPAEPVKLVQRRRTSRTISDKPRVAIAR